MAGKVGRRMQDYPAGVCNAFLVNAFGDGSRLRPSWPSNHVLYITSSVQHRPSGVKTRKTGSSLILQIISTEFEMFIDCHIRSLLLSQPSRSSWQDVFQHASQSRAALRDFNARCEVQPPDRHGLWFRDAIPVHPSPLMASIPREPKHLDAALKCAQSCNGEGLLALGYHYQAAHHEP